MKPNLIISLTIWNLIIDFGQDQPQGQCFTETNNNNTFNDIKYVSIKHKMYLAKLMPSDTKL